MHTAPALTDLYVYCTSGCNLACRHCWIDPVAAAPVARGNERYLAPDLLADILEQGTALGLRAVKLTGGEPLLHPHVSLMLKSIADRGLNLRLETNATLLTDGHADLVAESRDAFAAVSLDGSTSEIHDQIRGVRGCFDKAVRGIAALIARGIHVQIIMTIMRANYRHVDDVIRLGRQLGVRSVKLNVLQPSGRAVVISAKGGGLSIAESVELGRRVEQDYPLDATFRVYFDHPPAFIPLGRLLFSESAEPSGCGIHHILGVLSDGSYALCGVGANYRELSFGHAERDSLAAVWNDAPVLRSLRSGLPNRLGGVCGRCVHKMTCLGMCVAQNFLAGGGLFGPHWYCAAAAAAGLFPASRLQDPTGAPE